MIAVIDRSGQAVTFEEMDRQVAAVRGGLVAQGMQPGDHVFFAVRPGLDALTLGSAILDIGATIVVADPGAGEELFAARAALVREAGGRTWVAAESLLYALTARSFLRGLIRRRGLLLPDFTKLDDARHIYTGRRLPGTPRGAIALTTLAPASAALPDNPRVADLPLFRYTSVPRYIEKASQSVDPQAPALIVFTSGTTTAPRAVVHTHATLAASRKLLNDRIGWGPGDIVHTDQLMIALPALAAGATWSLPGRDRRSRPRLRPRRADSPGQGIAERHPTHLFGTPAHIAELLDTGPLPPTLKCIMLGAAPVPPAILRRLRQAAPDAEILSIYGTTEALPIAITTAEAKLAHAADGDLLGEPLPGIRIRIDEDHQIHIRAPHLARYLDRALDELATGDLGRLDAQGRLVLLGRAKDMLIRGSFNLYPGLYEPAIAAQPGVADCAYVGVPDPETADEQVVLAVVAEPGQAPARLARRLSAELPRLIDAAACPDRIVPVTAIPRRGRTDKPDRDALRALLA